MKTLIVGMTFFGSLVWAECPNNRYPSSYYAAQAQQRQYEADQRAAMYREQARQRAYEADQRAAMYRAQARQRAYEADLRAAQYRAEARQRAYEADQRAAAYRAQMQQRQYPSSASTYVQSPPLRSPTSQRPAIHYAASNDDEEDYRPSTRSLVQGDWTPTQTSGGRTIAVDGKDIPSWATAYRFRSDGSLEFQGNGGQQEGQSSQPALKAKPGPPKAQPSSQVRSVEPDRQYDDFNEWHRDNQKILKNHQADTASKVGALREDSEKAFEVKFKELSGISPSEEALKMAQEKLGTERQKVLVRIDTLKQAYEKQYGSLHQLLKNFAENIDESKDLESKVLGFVHKEKTILESAVLEWRAEIAAIRSQTEAVNVGSIVAEIKAKEEFPKIIQTQGALAILDDPKSGKFLVVPNGDNGTRLARASRINSVISEGAFQAALVQDGGALNANPSGQKLILLEGGTVRGIYDPPVAGASFSSVESREGKWALRFTGPNGQPFSYELLIDKRGGEFESGDMKNP